jgi:hypothetical protein
MEAATHPVTGLLEDLDTPDGPYAINADIVPGESEGQVAIVVVSCLLSTRLRFAMGISSQSGPTNAVCLGGLQPVSRLHHPSR